MPVLSVGIKLSQLTDANCSLQPASSLSFSGMFVLSQKIDYINEF